MLEHNLLISVIMNEFYFVNSNEFEFDISFDEIHCFLFLTKYCNEAHWGSKNVCLV